MNKPSIRPRVPLEAPVTDKKLDEFRSRIKLDKNDLDSASEEQAQLYLDACEEHDLAASRRDQAKDYLAEVDATLANEIRSKAASKMTEGAIYDQVILDPKHKAASKDYYVKKLLAANWTNVVKALDMRRDMIRDLTHQYASGYFALDAAVFARRTQGSAAGREALHVARTTK